MFGHTSMLKTYVFRGLVMLSILTLLGILAGCAGSGSSSVNTPSAMGAVQVKVGDAPADSVLSFELTIAKVDLQPQSGNAVTVMNSPEEIELTHLSGTLEPLVLTKVPFGTYTGAAITVSKAEVTYIPSGATVPVQKEIALNKTVNVTFNPSLNVGAGSAIVNIDLNLAQSLTFDANGNVTGITPMFTITTASVPSGGEQGEDEEHGMMEDIVGQVTATTPASGSTLASFTITPRMAGQPQTYFVDSSTQFEDGLAQFSDIKLNMVVKVDAVTRTDGSLLATKIEMVEASEGIEAEGIVTGTTGSPVTSFQLLMHEGSGSSMSSAMLGTTLTVNVGNAVFRAPLSNSDDSNLLSGLPFTPKFDATTLTKGQSVEADASGQMPSQGTINASKIQLRRQSLNGTVGQAAAGSNATFSLLLDADSAFAKLTGTTSINVYVVSSTKMKGISGATQGSKVKVRGLIFFDGSNYQFVAATISNP